MRRLLAASLLLVAMLAVGCQMKIEMTTTVLPSLEMDQEIVMTMPGFGEEVPEDAMMMGDPSMAAEGWTQEVTKEGDALVMRMSKHLQPGDALFPPGDDSPPPQFDLQVADTPLGREYRLTAIMPASDSGMPASEVPDEEMDPELSAFGDELAEEFAEELANAFKVSWTINLPGEVVETNADRRTESGGTWEFRLDQMQQDRELRLVTRERKP